MIVNCFIFLAITTAALLCEAFLSTLPLKTTSSGASATTFLRGIHEWRDDSRVTEELDASLGSYAPATLPILPFPFYDVLLQGERKHLNLYEDRFHKLFGDALENHCGMIGMGLLAGSGMMTILPLCEVESFTRFGANENWRDKGDGMGNGSILVTIRAVGRCKITESGLLQETPYMKAWVVELLDEEVALEAKTGGGLKEKSSTNVRGESTPTEIASLVAGNVEKLMSSLASMEHRLKEIETEKTSLSSAGGSSASSGKDTANNDGNGGEVMNRRLVNAQLESLFMTDSCEGLDMEHSEVEGGEIIMEDEDECEDEVHESKDADVDENGDRFLHFRQAIKHAKEVDTFGYVTETTTPQMGGYNQQSTPIRKPQDLAAISWAVFVGEKEDAQQKIMKIQALSFTNVLQRLQLGAALLREEEKKVRAKLALAGIQESGDGEGAS